MMIKLFVLLVCVVTLATAQWRELESDGPVVLTTEPDARPPAQEGVSMWCHSHDVYVLGNDNIFWKYEGESARWLWLCPAPIAGKHFAHWSMRDMFYLFGDRHIYSHNPITREWVFLSNATGPATRTLSATWSDPINNRLFMYGGQNENDNVLADMWSYNVENGQWSSHGGSQAPGPLTSASAARIEEQLYMFGGDTTTDSQPSSNVLWKMDLNTLAWQRLDLSDNTQPAARVGHVLFAKPEKDGILLFGGRHGSTVYGDLWLFDLEKQVWSHVNKGSKPASRFNPSSCIDSESATWLFGGSANVNNDEELRNDIWRYGGTTHHILAEFFRIDFNAVQVSSVMAGVCSMLTLIGLVIFSVVACIYKCRKKRHTQMSLPVEQVPTSSTYASGAKDDLF